MALNAAPEFHFVCVVADEAVPGFLELVLPSLMTTNNLLGFARWPTSLQFINSAGAGARLLQDKRVQFLTGFVDIGMTHVEGAPESDSAGILATLRRVGIEAGAGERHVGWIPADVMWADGALQFARATLASGADAALVPAVPAPLAAMRAWRASRPVSRFGDAYAIGELIAAWREAAGDHGSEPKTHALSAYPLLVAATARAALVADGDIEVAVPSAARRRAAATSDDAFGIRVTGATPAPAPPIVTRTTLPYVIGSASSALT